MAVFCPECGRPVEEHKVAGLTNSVQRRLRCVFRLDGTPYQEHLPWLANLVTSRFKADTGETPTLVEKATHEHDIVMLQEMHDAEIQRKDADFEKLGEQLVKSEERITELRKAGRKCIELERRNDDLEKQGADLSERGVELERENAALLERLKMLEELVSSGKIIPINANRNAQPGGNG